MNRLLEFHAKNIQFLEFEINNQCQFANRHSWCPRHLLGTSPVITLETEIIEKVFSFFKPYDFSGTVYLSIYNEPTLDKRILDLVRLAKKELHKCTIQMYTNGVGLTKEFAVELLAAGVDIFRLSVYGKVEDYSEIVSYIRSKGYNNFIETPIRTYEGMLGHDRRIHVYDVDPSSNKEINSSCYMPMIYYLVTCSGDVMFCWDDWKNLNKCGNLYRDSVEDTLLNPGRLGKIELLKYGNRNKINPCKGCDRPTEMCITEYRTRLRINP